jgi:hypothetical protein
MTISGFEEYRLGSQFVLSAEHVAVCDSAAKFFMGELFPLQQRMDDEDWWPADVFRKVAQMGYLGTTVPTQWGGQGLDYLTSGLICESMAYANPSFAFSWLNADNLVIDNLCRNASASQKEKYLPGLCRGEIVGALGMTEPSAGSDALGSMKTKAERDGDYYILNGSKIYITNGPIADIVIVYAKTDFNMGRSKGISAFIVEKDFAGFAVAQKLDKMGFRGSPLGELVFDNCRVPVSNLLGEENAGHVIMHSGLDLERVMSQYRSGAPGARPSNRVRQIAGTIRQADFNVPNDSIEARRNVRGARDRSHVCLSRLGCMQQHLEHQPWPRSNSQDGCGGAVSSSARRKVRHGRGRTNSWRPGLHARYRGKSPLSHDQGHGNCRRIARDPQIDHCGRFAGVMFIVLRVSSAWGGVTETGWKLERRGC